MMTSLFPPPAAVLVKMGTIPSPLHFFKLHSSSSSTTTGNIIGSSSTPPPRRTIMLSTPNNTNTNTNTRLTTTRDGDDGTYNSTTSTTKSALIIDHAEDQQQKSMRRKVVLLLDIMDTVVTDPFYQHVPAFFRMSLNQLIECKHPTAWADFETGLIDEMELARIFFKDGRPFDLEGLKSCMRRAYSYIQGMEELLCVLKQNDYEMHALTNYPIWYQMIEDKLKLSKYLSWSFCSCSIGKRKPDLELYAEVVRRLDIEPENCIFIDDRMRNVEAAVNAGMVGLQFKDAKTLRHNLSLLGIQTESQQDHVLS